eukprot:14333925-Heterocapsa_arctica.AAC.1
MSLTQITTTLPVQIDSDSRCRSAGSKRRLGWRALGHAVVLEPVGLLAAPVLEGGRTILY